MRRLSGTLAGLALLVSCGQGQAATVGPGGTAQGITYELTVVGGSLASNSASFLLHITGINAVTDTIGGRSAINDFAIGGANALVGEVGVSAFGSFQAGGLDSDGCNGNGNFFCFNGPATNNSPALPANSTIDINFSLTLSAGQNFAAWIAGPIGFKIDWLGSANNYDLVSQDFVGSLTPTPTGVETPLPGAVWLFAGGVAGLAELMRRRKNKEAKL